MKKNMYIQPDVQVTEMTGMQIMQGISPSPINSGGNTDIIGVDDPVGD